MSEAAVLGKPIDRVDGPLKTSGTARYAAEFHPPGMAYAVMVQSTVASGRIVRIDRSRVEAMPGVIAVLTHENAPVLPNEGRAAFAPPAGRAMSLLQEDRVRYNGEPIAVVVAETFEQAVDAAGRLHVEYATEPAVLSFDAARSSIHKPSDDKEGADLAWGDFEAGLHQAQVQLEETYTTSIEHHNPLEPHATVAVWDSAPEPSLTLYDATQYVNGVKQTVAKTLGIDPERVRVVNPFVGGGFGSKGSTWSHVVLAALAARQTGRPVKLAVSRPQMFGPVGSRPQTEQRLLLAARSNGELTAIRHEVVSHTSVFEDYSETSSEPTRALYRCMGGVTSHRVVCMNVGTPTFQRAPGESTGTFALESAMDELAVRLGIDPVELRLRNHADKEPSTGQPWSSKRLRECYALAAERFGWSRRPAEPRAMRDGTQLIGWGMATATYPAKRMPAQALARLEPDGTVLVRSGTQDLGTGTYTVMTQVAGEALGLPTSRIQFELGDTDFPKAPVSGGSMTVASVGPAVRAACERLRAKIAEESKSGESLEALAARLPQPLEARAEEKPGDKKVATRSFGAVFVEARVDADLGVIRVPRIVAAYSVGKVLNEKTAINQLQGGIVWGLSQALFEESLLDPRYGRYANNNLAEYHVPVNADVGEIDVSLVEEEDFAFNPLGARGIGEIGITGVAAAIANAIFHATGRRVRDLPITLEDLL